MSDYSSTRRELTDYLRALRKQKGIKQLDIAENISQNHIPYKKSSLPQYIYQYENYNLSGIDHALEGREPSHTIFLLYLQAMQLSEVERGKVEVYVSTLSSSFDWKVDITKMPQRTVKVWEELSMAQKLNRLSKTDQESVSALVNSLYKKIGGENK